MLKVNNKTVNIVPEEIIEAVKKIEAFARNTTTRDDWAIGDITCRRGAQRLLDNYNKLLNRQSKTKHEDFSYTRCSPESTQR